MTAGFFNLSRRLLRGYESKRSASIWLCNWLRECTEYRTCHAFELASSASTCPLTHQANKLPRDAWWYFGLAAQSGWQPPCHAMHKLTCTNVCASLVQERLWPLCWMQAQLLGLVVEAGEVAGSDVRLLLVRLASPQGHVSCCSCESATNKCLMNNNITMNPHS